MIMSRSSLTVAHDAHIRRRRRHALSVLILLLLLQFVWVGCLGRKATPPSTLVYEGPATYTLKPGDYIPGTTIRYLNRTDAGAEFLIADQKALKQRADSLNWSGSPAAGVDLVLNLRILHFNDKELYAAGTARVTINDVASTPQAGDIDTQSPLAYDAPVAYTLQKGGDSAPGTLLRYEGKTAEGAQFSGVAGYPYRQPGDSLRWEGRVRPNVSLRLDLRVVHFDDEAARLVGIAHLWISH